MSEDDIRNTLITEVCNRKTIKNCVEVLTIEPNDAIIDFFNSDLTEE